MVLEAGFRGSAGARGATGSAMAQMAMLKVRDEVRVDTRRLDEIVFELGARAAHQVFDSALEKLSAELHRVEAAAAKGDAAAIVAAADQIGRLAWRLGLVTLSGVAVDLARCAERGDPIACAAVRARLLRVGSCSLEALLDEAAIG